MEMVLQILILVLGFVCLVKGSDWFVDGAAGIATKFGIPQLIIGLTIVALGTSLPELFTSVTAAAKKNCDIAIGNIIGSNLFNILFVVGLSSLIIPVPFVKDFLVDILFSLASVVALLLFCLPKKRLSRVCGAIFLIAYLVYFILWLV